MGVLEILLVHGADPDTVAKGFCTPLHCPAISGWTRHAIALIEAGAEVYTGPQCSPLCWAKDGSGSNHPVVRLLREKLGPEGMKLIEEDHHRQASPFSQGGSIPYVQRSGTQSAVQPNLSTYRTARSKTAMFGRQARQSDHGGYSPALRLLNSDTVCLTCANLSLDDLVRYPGYVHLSSLELVLESATSRSFCKVIFAILGHERTIVKGGVTQVIVQAITGELDQYQPGHILRMLELKLSAGCFCDKSYEASDRSLDFRNCHGECEMLGIARAGIFRLEDV